MCQLDCEVGEIVSLSSVPYYIIKVFYEGPESKYFRLLVSCSLCHKLLTHLCHQ